MAAKEVRDEEGSTGKRWRDRTPDIPLNPAHLEKGQGAKLDGQGDVIQLYRGWREPLLYMDWFFRPWVYMDSVQHFMAWYSSAGFYFGAICFVIGSFTSITPGIYNSEVYGNCMGDAYDWWVNFLFLLGDVLWQPAVIFQVIEAQNHDWEPRYEAWFLGGRIGPPPKYRWFAFEYASLEWWGGMCYTIGVVGYVMTGIAPIVYDCHDSMNIDVYVGITTYTYMGCGILFLIAGALFSMHLIHPWLLPAICLPYKRRDWGSMMWWALWAYFWGGVFFCFCGIFYYWDSFNNDVVSFKTYQIIQVIGFGGGSFLFWAGAALLLSRQSRGRCRPSYQQIHQRYDRTERADPARTAAANLPAGFTKISAEPLRIGGYGRPVGRLSDPAADENYKPANGYAQV